MIGALTGEREAYPSARFTDHEVDKLGRDELRRTDEVAFVLAILVVRDNDKLAGLDVGNGLLDCSELHNPLMLQREIGHGTYRGCLAQVGLDQSAKMFGNHIGLHVHPASDFQVTQSGVTQCVIDQ